MIATCVPVPDAAYSLPKGGNRRLGGGCPRKTHEVRVRSRVILRVDVWPSFGPSFFLRGLKFQVSRRGGRSARLPRETRTLSPGFLAALLALRDKEPSGSMAS